MEILTVEQIKEALVKDQYLLETAIVAIWEKQTEDEQRSKTTNHTNGVGFAHCDAFRGARMAEYILKGVNHYGKDFGQNLTGTHLEKAKKFMPKYAKQLYKLQLAKLEASKPKTEPKASQYNPEDMDGEWEIYQQMTEDIEAGRL